LKTLKLIISLAIYSCSPSLISAQIKDTFFLAVGDMPYTVPAQFPIFESLIQQVNASDALFTIHVGDFKSSTTLCSNELFTKMHGYFETFEKPLIYTPGDNEWTDCYKKEAGSYSANERLDKLRLEFFADNKSFGKMKIDMTTQSDTKKFAKYKENRLWNSQGILFATLHVVGTNNNFYNNSQDRCQEFYERQDADLAWLEEVFMTATKTNVSGIVISMQADMFRAGKDPMESGFVNIKKKLRELSIAFAKPVLLINGDSHEFLIDKPFVTDAPDVHALQNFTRLQVPGENNLYLAKIRINHANPALFEFSEFFLTQTTTRH
jgi:hypothetical protein